MVKYQIPRFVIQIDDEDLDRVSQFKWRSDRGKYIRREGIKPCMLPRFLMNLAPLSEDKRVVVLVDGNWLNNQKSNLYITTRAEIARKTIQKNKLSGYYGVTWCISKQEWRAYISYHDCIQYIYSGKDPIECALAYDKKAIELFGSNTTLNFPLVA